MDHHFLLFGVVYCVVDRCIRSEIKQNGFAIRRSEPPIQLLINGDCGSYRRRSCIGSLYSPSDHDFFSDFNRIGIVAYLSGSEKERKAKLL